MPVYNQEFGRCIRELLKRHNQTVRDAERFCNGEVSRSTISNMENDIIVHRQKVYSFLKYYPQDERLLCWQTTGWDVPVEWIEDRELVEAVEYTLGKFRDLDDDGRQRIIDAARREAERIKQRAISDSQDAP